MRMQADNSLRCVRVTGDCMAESVSTLPLRLPSLGSRPRRRGHKMCHGFTCAGLGFPAS